MRRLAQAPNSTLPHLGDAICIGPMNQTKANRAEPHHRIDGGVRRMRASLNQAAQLLNYRPAIDLPTGLRLTLEKDRRLRQK